MPYDLFWEGEPILAKSYREAYRLSRDRANFDSWLLGAYMYEVLVRVSPVFHDFVKEAKPQEYMSEPFDIYAAPPEKAPHEEASAKQKAGIAFMDSFMALSNSKRSGGQADGEEPAS